jgi:hypothetical protein
MATHVQTTTKAVVNSEQTAAVTFSGNVTNGNKLIIGVTMYDDAAIPTITSSWLTKTAGTSTIGTIALDRVVQSFNVEDTEYIATAIYSCNVTGTGSLTLTIDAVSPNTLYWFMAASEFSPTGTWESAVTAVNSATQATNNTTAVVSGDVATTGAGVIYGVLAPYASANPFTMTEDGAFTLAAQETNFSANMGGELIYRTVSSGTTDSADWTIGSTNGGFVVAAAAYSETGGAPAVKYLRNKLFTLGVGA